MLAHVFDNDTAGVTITETGGSTDINEQGPTSDTYEVVLNTQPTANVTVTVTPDAASTVGGGAAHADHADVYPRNLEFAADGDGNGGG